MKRLALWTIGVTLACSPCVEWTRFEGRVKAVNLRASSVTIQNRDGDLITIPIDYQVKIIEKHDEQRGLKDLVLDEKIILTRVPAEAPQQDSEGLAPPQAEIQEPDNQRRNKK